MAVLHRKLLRDLLYMKGQAIAIALVVACGVASFVTMRAMYRSLLRSQADYYANYRFADVFAELKRAPDSVADRISLIPGVARVEQRLVMDVTLDVPGLAEPAVGRLISIQSRQSQELNALFIRQGRYILPGADSEVIASDAFAKANQLVLGSELHAVINGRWQRLTIVGIALSPEYIYEIRGGGSVFPDNRRFGVLWMSADALQGSLNMKGAFNSIIASLQPRAREDDVIPQLDRILSRYGSLGAYGRSDQISHRFISDEISQNRISANVIPSIFLAVAALLVHLSFSRLVNMQRSEIAVIKAFGYSSWQVGVHYVEFSLVVAMLGYVLGCGVGWYFGIKLASLYAEFYRFPILVYKPELQMFVLAGLITAVMAIAGSTGAVIKAASLPPAEAMRPEAPPQFRPRFVDSLKPTWTSPALRMMLRNIERRPWRALVSTFAICCSVMIVVVEFGMFDALDRMLKLQFSEIQREDISVTLNEARSGRARFDLARLTGVITSEPFRPVPVRLRNEHRWRKTTLLGLGGKSNLRRIVDREGNAFEIPTTGLLISTALASALQVAPGDKLTVEILEGRRLVREMPVVATVDDLLGTTAYMDMHSLNRLLDEDYVISGALLKVDSAKQEGLYQLLKTMPAVASVSIKEAAVTSSRETIDRSMSLSIGTLMIFAAVIAVGMIYNGARIALSERARELATLRILGFTRREITFILLGEQAIITIAALPCGFAAGYALCAILSARMQTELYRMPLVVQPTSYAWAFLIVLSAAIISGILVSRRIANLDMIAVLKARE